jgi:hypothetical protein
MSHNPPFTRNQCVGVALMAIAAIVAMVLLGAYAEAEIQRATRAWPPHVTQERSSK